MHVIRADMTPWQVQDCIDGMLMMMRVYVWNVCRFMHVRFMHYNHNCGIYVHCNIFIETYAQILENHLAFSVSKRLPQID